MIASDRPDALVLDVMMPRLDGLEVCRQLRSSGDDLPILVLTARDSVSERVAGLDAGADDYLPKPFALEELLARVRALLRRTKPEDDAESVAMTFSDLALDPRNPRSHVAAIATISSLTPHRIRVAGDTDHEPAPRADPQPHPRRGVGIRLPHLSATRWKSMSAICAAKPRPTAR